MLSSQVKFSADGQTDRQTDKDTDRWTDRRTLVKQYAPDLLMWGHKRQEHRIWMPKFNPFPEYNILNTPF